MEISKEELLEERLATLEEAFKLQSKKLSDLMEYLTRVDDNFKRDERHFTDWRSRLKGLQEAERITQEIHQAKQVLGYHGYIVVAEEAEIDAARMKRWLNTKATPPDDIPF